MALKEKVEVVKNFVEIIAIILAGAFAFFTWGLDYIDSNKPSVDLDFTQADHLTAKEVNGINKVCPDTTCRDSLTGCIIATTLKIINKGNRPIVVGKTFISVYFMERSALAGITNDSPYEYLKRTCKFSKDQCKEADTTLIIPGLDTTKNVYPDEEVWRPLTLEINPLKLNPPSRLTDFASKYVLLILAEQEITVKNSFIRSDEEKPRFASILLQDICGLRKIKEETNLKKKSKRTGSTSHGPKVKRQAI